MRQVVILFISLIEEDLVLYKLKTNIMEVITKEESHRIIDTTRALHSIRDQVQQLRGLGIRFLEVNKTRKECEEEAEKRYGCSIDKVLFIEGALFGSGNG